MAKLIPLEVLKCRMDTRSKRDPVTGCLVWTGARHEQGYGRIWNGERLVYVHRLTWECEHGPVPEGMDVLHNCLPHPDNPSCREIGHLWCGTHAQNMADRDAKGRTRNGADKIRGLPNVAMQGTGHPKAKLTDDQVREIRAFPWLPGTEAAVKYGVSPSLIYGIRKGKNWGWLK